MSHNGVLFLDELPEFNRRTLEVLRQPLEDGTVTISRALNSTTFPANFMLIAALNPCPCGYRGDSRRSCNCSTPQIERYMSKISGPLLDRIDIHIEVPAVPFRELSGGTPGTSSAEMRAVVAAARQRQAARFNGSATRYNADMSHRQTRQFCVLDNECSNLLEGGDDRDGPFRPGPRQDPPRGPNHRRPGQQRRGEAAPLERGDQLPDAGSEFVDVGTPNATPLARLRERGRG